MYTVPVYFFQLYQFVKERILPLPQTLLCFYPLTVTVAILLECINMIPELFGIFAQRFV